MSNQHYKNKNIAHHDKDSSPDVTRAVHRENRLSITNNLDVNITGEIEELEREADIQSKELELSDYIESVSQLIDLFKHTIIVPELQCDDHWQENVEHQLRRNKGITGNSLLDNQVEKIATSKGLTKEQWRHLLYINFTAGDTLDMVNVTRNHLKKVHDLTNRLLEGEEQTTVIALLDAIEKHIPKSHLIEK